jgi:topoisomerase IV subunit B
MMENKYTADNLTLLKGLEPVRERPGMYIGSTDINGLHHLVWEIVDNSVDEANAGYGKLITVTIHTDGSISIEDEGRGVPCDFNHKEKMSGFDMVYRTLHAGGKFDESNYKTAGGLHGVGGAVVNALSSWLEVHSYRDGQDHFIRYEKGGKKESEIKVTDLAKVSKRGTLVTFMPDSEIFEDTNFDYQKIASSLDDRACLTKGVTFVLSDERSNRRQEFLYANGIHEYFATHSFGKTPICDPISIEGEADDIKVEFVGQFYSDSYTENISAFANGVRTPDGGHHVIGLKKALTVSINKFASDHKLIKASQSLDGEDIREGFACLLSVWIPENILEFEGQTKSKLGTKEANNAVDTVIETKLGYYLQEHAQDATNIVNKALLASEAREKAKKAKDSIRELSKAGVKDSNLSGKLTPASSKNYKTNELFIVEGDSAGGSAKKCRDREHQAILPLRGKPKNVVGEDSADIYDNKELNTIVYTIGAGCDEDFKVKDMHYDKIIIMTDADDDGCHIQNLLMSFFYEHMRELIVTGHLYIACPPLYRVAKKDKEIYCWTDEDLDKARVEIGNGYVLSRYKGLGEMDADQLGKTTMSPLSRRLIQVTISDFDECTDKVNLFMSKDTADRRKDWIDANVDFGFHKDHFEEIKSHEEK